MNQWLWFNNNVLKRWTFPIFKILIKIGWSNILYPMGDKGLQLSHCWPLELWSQSLCWWQGQGPRTAWRWSPPAHQDETEASRKQSGKEPADCVRQTQSQVRDCLWKKRWEEGEEPLINLYKSSSVWEEALSYRVTLVYLLGLMDSSGTKTSVKVISAEGVSVWVGDISRNVATGLGWASRRAGAGCSEVKAGMGFGEMLAPDRLWRSLRVGLDCCLSLKAEKWTTHLFACVLFTGCSILPSQSQLKKTRINVFIRSVNKLWQFQKSLLPTSGLVFSLSPLLICKTTTKSRSAAFNRWKLISHSLCECRQVYQIKSLK